MLFLAFDSLFNNIDVAVEEIKMELSKESVPEQWTQRIDVFGESKLLLYDSELSDLLKLITLMNRVLVMKDFFSVCTSSLLIFKAENSFGQMLPTGDDIAR